MTRVKKGFTKHQRHKKILAQAKGFRWGRNDLFRLAKNAVMKSGQNAYRDRKLKKRDFKSLWIVRISAFLREKGTKYSEFFNKYSQSAIFLNRKILSDLCALHPEVMNKIIEKVNKA